MAASEEDRARDVLWDFHEACPMPTDEDVRQWQSKHPKYADLIAECAVVTWEDALDPEIDGDEEFVEPEVDGVSEERRIAGSM